MTQTDTTTAQIVPPVTVLDTILTQLAAVSLEGARLRPPKKCKHYTPLGVVDEPTRRLMVFSEALAAEIAGRRAAASKEANEMAEANQVKLDACEIEADARQIVRDVNAKLKEIGDRFDRETYDARLRLRLLDTLLRLEVERQYPELVGKEKVIYNEDCSVGYVDHQAAKDEAIDSMRAQGYEPIGDFDGMGMAFVRTGHQPQGEPAH